MRNTRSSRWALVAVASCAIVVFAISVGSQQRVQSTTQLTVRTPVVAGPLTEWEKQYAEAMKVAEELIASGKADHGRRLENDLRALDEALRDFVRASERLRHKDRAMAQTMDFLVNENAMQAESRQFNTISNALKVRHDSALAAIRNLK